MAKPKEIQGATLRDKLEALRRMYPKRTPYGFLHTNRRELTASTKRATVFLYIVSSDDTYAIHTTLFNKKDNPKTPKQWAAWFAKHALGPDGIFEQRILPGVNIRSQKIWHIKAFLGFITHDLHRTPRASLLKRRNQTQPQGSTHGQNHLRRRHRNRSRHT